MTEAEPRRVEIDIRKFADIANRGVRRAASFVALGHRAWSDESLTSVAIPAPIGFRFMPDPLPKPLADEVRLTFKTWLCGSAIAELMQAIALFSDGYYELATYIKYNSQRVPDEELMRIGRFRNDTNSTSKLKTIEADHGIRSGLLDHSDGWSRARNTHAHNHGIVRERDCSPGLDVLRITWRQFEIIVGGEKIEDVIGKRLEKESSIGFRLGEGSKDFAVRSKVEFSEQEIMHLCLTTHIHIENMVSTIAKRLVDPPKKEELPPWE